MSLPVEIVIPEQSFHQAHNDHVSYISTYVKDGMIFDFHWATGELHYEGFHDVDKLVLHDEHLALFGRKHHRSYNYLRFGVNKETHELTLRLV